jgi:hypothetical protein
MHQGLANIAGLVRLNRFHGQFQAKRFVTGQADPGDADAPRRRDRQGSRLRHL